jgi:hypothetical protein
MNLECVLYRELLQIQIATTDSRVIRKIARKWSRYSIYPGVLEVNSCFQLRMDANKAKINMG